MTPYLHDPDVTLYVGDVRETLALLDDDSVDCVVTSPPYWGLRDYGTGEWTGGDADCDHSPREEKRRDSRPSGGLTGGMATAESAGPRGGAFLRSSCERCGAIRVDQQIGLEHVPDCLGWATGESCGSCFVCSLVGVFREVRRVLAPHGVLWLNLGDSYTSKARGSDEGWRTSRLTNPGGSQKIQGGFRVGRERHRGKESDLDEKNLAGVPWRVALALQADGWYLRSDVVWSKNNPMPESVTDRPTKSHEYVFMLAKRSSYFFDQEAVREKPNSDRAQLARAQQLFDEGGLTEEHLAAIRSVGITDVGKAQVTQSGYGKNSERTIALADEAKAVLGGYYREFLIPNGRNVRTVWEIATQPYSEAHFATFPQELARRCILAGCPEWVCQTCGKPRVRIVERGEPELQADTWSATGAAQFNAASGEYEQAESSSTLKHVVPRETVGWTDCGHDDYRPGVVLDPFMGSGTTALVARNHGRHAVGIELNPEYADMIARRLQQLSLLS